CCRRARPAGPVASLQPLPAAPGGRRTAAPKDRGPGRDRSVGCHYCAPLRGHRRREHLLADAHGAAGPLRARRARGPGHGIRLALALQQPQTIRINYVNADLGDVIRSLATVLGVNVVLTDVPSRRITFQTPEPVPAPQVGAVLEAILESQGLVIVQTGPVAQVMPEEKRPTTGPVRVGKELPTPPPLGLVTQIV